MYLWDFLALKPFHDSSLYLVCILPQPAFYSQSAVFISHTVCILPLVRRLQSAVSSLRFTLTVVVYIVRVRSESRKKSTDLYVLLDLNRLLSSDDSLNKSCNVYAYLHAEKIAVRRMQSVNLPNQHLKHISC